MRIETALMCLAAAFAARGASAEGRAGRGAPADAPSAEPASDEPEKTAAAGEAETFEGLAQSAQAAGDVGALVGALVDRCADDKRPGEREGERGHERSIDRARCRATLAFLRKALPQHPFSVVAPDAAAISVSPYDETLKGYRVGLSACVACTSPIRVGRSPDPIFVTLKKPGEARPGDAKPGESKAGEAKPGEAKPGEAKPGEAKPGEAKPGEAKPGEAKPADTLAAAVEVASVPLGFPSQAEARRWLADVRPHLRAELIFSATASEWRFRATRGYALGLVAARIVDSCTGTVVLSAPPSTGLGERAVASPDNPDLCKSAPRAARLTTATSAETPAAASSTSTDDDDEAPLPSELSHNVIAQAMGQIRAQVFACYERYGVRGTVPLTYEVAGNGLVQSVRIGGPLGGTPTGVCVLEAARGARFPRFDGPIQTFTYPFFLRR